MLGGVNKLKESRAHGDAYEVPAADMRGAQRSITLRLHACESTFSRLLLTGRAYLRAARLERGDQRGVDGTTWIRQWKASSAGHRSVRIELFAARRPGLRLKIPGTRRLHGAARAVQQTTRLGGALPIATSVLQPVVHSETCFTKLTLLRTTPTGAFGAY